MRRFKLHIILFLIAYQNCYAQDIHFSQADKSNLNVNPALAGFENDVNISANYKTQWNPTLSPFKTYAFSADAAFKGHQNSNWNFAVGGMLYKDQAGEPQLSTTVSNAYFASKVKLTKRSFLGAGLYFGYRQMTIQNADGQWASQFDGQAYDATLSSGESFRKMTVNGFGSGLGFVYSYNSNQKSRLQNNSKALTVGVSIFNLNKPKTSFLEDSDSKLSQRYSIFAKGKVGLFGTIISLKPSVFYNRQGVFNELVFGSDLVVDLRNSSKYYGALDVFNVSLGVFYRLKDAIVARAVLEIGELNLGLSYDFNLSTLQNSSKIRGGTELYLAYTLKSYKRR